MMRILKETLQEATLPPGGTTRREAGARGAGQSGVQGGCVANPGRAGGRACLPDALSGFWSSESFHLEVEPLPEGEGSLEGKVHLSLWVEGRSGSHALQLCL